jgi:hypothetical protein
VADDDNTGQEPTTPPDTDPTAPADGERRPPWERSGEPFDPNRAWTLIERLRTDLAAARTPAAPAAPSRAEPSTAPPAPAATDVDTLRAELVRERVARKFGLDDDLVELLGTGDEATITARAKTLADRLTTTSAPSSGSPVPRCPVEQLRGDADPTIAPEETDPVKLAAKVRRGF